MPIVYQATNRENGHRYIGVSKKSLHRRRGQHFAHAKARPEKQPFLQAIADYGQDAFEWIVLEEHEDYGQAVEAEIRLIAALKPEYNVARGGCSTKEVKRSPEWIAQWLARRHVGPEASSRAVICLDDGQKYESASAAARHYDVAKSSVIEMCLGRALRRSVGKRRFAYVAPTDEERRLYEARDSRPRRGKITKDGVENGLAPQS